jgi:hypothetical protein
MRRHREEGSCLRNEFSEWPTHCVQICSDTMKENFVFLTLSSPTSYTVHINVETSFSVLLGKLFDMKKSKIFFKEQCHEINFFESLNTFSLPFTIINFYLLLWNYLLNLKMLTKTLLKIPFSVIDRCFPVSTSHRLPGKCARINMSQAASGMILQNHRWLPACIFSVKIAAVGCLKRVTESIFKICKYFQRSKLKLWLFHQQEKNVKTISACRKSTYLTL